MARVAARREPEGSEAEQEFLIVTNRKLVQASEDLIRPMRRKNSRLSVCAAGNVCWPLVRELTQGGDLAEGDDLPKAADFVAWNERIANAIAPGGPAEYVRGYLKTTAERCWRLVNWLTNASNAARDGAELALSATSHVVNNYASSVLKRRAGAPERCGRCKSYRIKVEWRTVSPETRLNHKFPTSGPPLIWEMKKGTGYSSPATAGDHLVFLQRVGKEEIEDCLKPDTGERYWQYRYPADYED